MKYPNNDLKTTPFPIDTGCGCHDHEEQGRTVSSIGRNIQVLFLVSALQTLVPRQAFTSVMAGPVTAILSMMVLAVILNLCSEADAFIAPQKTTRMSAPEAIKGKEPETLDISISRLTQEWDRYKNSKVSIEGLFYEPVGNNKDMAIVFRYLVTCCAADARPIGLVIKKENFQQIKNDG